eukprot:EG_transcript_19496
MEVVSQTLAQTTEVTWGNNQPQPLVLCMLAFVTAAALTRCYPKDGDHRVSLVSTITFNAAMSQPKMCTKLPQGKKCELRVGGEGWSGTAKARCCPNRGGQKPVSHRENTSHSPPPRGTHLTQWYGCELFLEGFIEEHSTF